MNERESQISYAMSIIQKICEEYEIRIIPYKNDNVSSMLLVEDAKNENKYALKYSLINNEYEITNDFYKTKGVK